MAQTIAPITARKPSPRRARPHAAASRCRLLWQSMFVRQVTSRFDELGSVPAAGVQDIGQEYPTAPRSRPRRYKSGVKPKRMIVGAAESTNPHSRELGPDHLIAIL